MSRVGDSRLAEFLQAPFEDDLRGIPECGPAAIEAFAAQGVHTQFQLIAKFLAMKDPGVGPVEHVERFYIWLCRFWPNGSSHRAGIVDALCRKLAITFPSLYDPEAYGRR